MTRKFNAKTEDTEYVVAVVKCVWEVYIKAAMYLPTSSLLLLKWKSKAVKELTTFEALASLLVKYKQKSYKKYIYLNV